MTSRLWPVSTRAGEPCGGFFLTWSISALQRCVSLWISSMYTYVYIYPLPLQPPSHPPFRRPRSSQSTELTLDRRLTVSLVFLRHISGSSIVSRPSGVGPGWRHGSKSGYWNNQARVDVVWTRVVAVQEEKWLDLGYVLNWRYISYTWSFFGGLNLI